MVYAELLRPEQMPAELEVFLNILEPIRGKLRTMATQFECNNILTQEETDKLVENCKKYPIYEQYRRVHQCVKNALNWKHNAVCIPVPGIYYMDIMIEQLLIAEDPIASAKEFAENPVKFMRGLGFTTVLECPKTLRRMGETCEYIDLRKIVSAGFFHFIGVVVHEPKEFGPAKTTPQ